MYVLLMTYYINVQKFVFSITYAFCHENMQDIADN